MVDMMFGGMGVGAAFLLAFVLARSVGMQEHRPETVSLTVTLVQRDGTAPKSSLVGAGLGLMVMDGDQIWCNTETSAGDVEDAVRLRPLSARSRPQGQAFDWASAEWVLELRDEFPPTARLAVYLATAPASYRPADRLQYAVRIARLGDGPEPQQAVEQELSPESGWMTVVALEHLRGFFVEAGEPPLESLDAMAESWLHESSPQAADSGQPRIPEWPAWDSLKDTNKDPVTQEDAEQATEWEHDGSTWPAIVRDLKDDSFPQALPVLFMFDPNRSSNKTAHIGSTTAQLWIVPPEDKSDKVRRALDPYITKGDALAPFSLQMLRTLRDWYKNRYSSKQLRGAWAPHVWWAVVLDGAGSTRAPRTLLLRKEDDAAPISDGTHLVAESLTNDRPLVGVDPAVRDLLTRRAEHSPAAQEALDEAAFLRSALGNVDTIDLLAVGQRGLAVGERGTPIATDPKWTLTIRTEDGPSQTLTDLNIVRPAIWVYGPAAGQRKRTADPGDKQPTVQARQDQSSDGPLLWATLAVSGQETHRRLGLRQDPILWWTRIARRGGPSSAKE